MSNMVRFGSFGDPSNYRGANLLVPTDFERSIHVWFQKDLNVSLLSSFLRLPDCQKHSEKKILHDIKFSWDFFANFAIRLGIF